jgi:hypothetical protein
VILDEVAPLLHKKFDAPTAVSVVDAPAQMVEAEALMVTLGAAFTVIVFEILAEQPEAVVPVTE